MAHISTHPSEDPGEYPKMTSPAGIDYGFQAIFFQFAFCRGYLFAAFGRSQHQSPSTTPQNSGSSIIPDVAIRPSDKLSRGRHQLWAEWVVRAALHNTESVEKHYRLGSYLLFCTS
jgi:hypothetical protein